MRFTTCWPIMLALAGFTGILPAGAAVFTVDTTADDASLSNCQDDIAADCSLRGAIVRANGVAEPSTIFVPSGVYSLTAGAVCHLVTHQRGVFNISTVSLCLASNITLVGEGADATIIDANGVHHVAYVSDGFAVEIRGVALRNGLGVAEHDPAAPGFLTSDGGAVDNSGTLMLVDSRISESVAPNGGGAVYNDNTLTLRRSQLVGNTASGAGGAVMNASFNALTSLTIQDSTIALNQAVTQVGGGVYNFGGIVSVTGSTISGNASAGPGGGLYNGNNSAAMEIVNSTISGNTSGSSGGGIENGSPNAVVLNNVTVANNVGATQQRGSTGGIAGGRFVLSNTLVAGNRDANGGTPDCFAPVTSNGYNLIQGSITNCTITGDTTGNIVGQDPQLGVLADNGGWTFTHAIGQDSPAVDAGSPAAPGSGASACAALDQRGFPRPLGARCDIGAVEHSGAFAITRIQPSTGGNAGTVTVLVSGNGFADGSSVRLARAGASDIVATPAQVDNGGSAISATFDLRDAPVGTWDVEVTRPDSTTQTLASAFTVQTGGSVDVWIDVPPFRLPRHGSARITIFYGNRGTVDALAVPLQISASSQYNLSTLFAVETPPSQPDQILVGYDQVPVNVQPAGSGYVSVPLLLPVVPAGFTGALQIQLDIPQPTPTADSSLFASIDVPYFLPSLTDAALSALVSGAMSYSPVAFNVTIDPALTGGLQQYVTNQLQRAVASGRNAFVAGLGTSPQFFSQAQLVVDTAIVGAWRTLHR